MSGPSTTATTVNELVTRASERAGLDDFGSDSWREGLTLLVDTVERVRVRGIVGEHLEMDVREFAAHRRKYPCEDGFITESRAIRVR